MRPLVLIGLLLVVLGIVAMVIPGFTFFTTERVADAGIFKIDVNKPHTIIFNPLVGGALLVTGLVLMLAGRKSAP